MRTIASSAGVRLASAIIRWNACSATEVEFAVPATISGTRRAVSAGTSTASKPTPMRATTSIAGEASISACRYGVPDNAMPAMSVSIGRNSACVMPAG